MTMDLSLTATGAITPLGFDLANSAAAIRAGLNRFQPIADSVVFDADDLDAKLIGSPAPIVTQGFVQQARWLRMIETAFEDFLEQLQINNIAIDWQQLPIILVLPNVVNTFMWPEESVADLLQENVIKKLAKHFNLPLFMPPNGYFMEGASGSARAIAAIARTLANSHYQRMVVIAVDSLLEPMILSQLDDAGRLKDNQNPSGLMPAEAATVSLFESSSNTVNTSQAHIVNAVHIPYLLDRENEDDQQPNPVIDHSKQLAQAIFQTLAPLQGQRFDGDIYIDINGEYWRSELWGNTLYHLKASSLIDIDSCREQSPANCTGDTGAASGLLATSLAVRSFARHYNHSQYTLICSVADDGHIGVILLADGQMQKEHCDG